MLDYLAAGGKLAIVIIGGLFLVGWMLYNVITSFRDFLELYTEHNPAGKPNVAYLVQRLAMLVAFGLGVRPLLAGRVTDVDAANGSSVVYNLGEEYLWIVLGGVALLAVLYLSRRVFQSALPFNAGAQHRTLSVGLARGGLLVAVGVVFNGGFQMAADSSAIAAGAQALFITQGLLTLAVFYRVGTAHFGLNRLIRDGYQSAAYLSGGVVLGLAYVISGAISANFTNLARYEAYYWITVGLSLVAFTVLLWAITWGMARWEAASLRDLAREQTGDRNSQRVTAGGAGAAMSSTDDTVSLKTITVPQGSLITRVLATDNVPLAASLGVFIALIGYLAGAVAI